ncbi:MAG: hypothetical protein J6S69_10770, partial [Proteobacteria bacterium]|nr:hypothetical protein [Pseudomonadota bacterium]
MQKFIPTLQVGNGYTYLKLKGILDEDNLLANFLGQIQGRLLLIDMAEIERINSCGVRDWVNWLNQIQALGVAVILLRCSPVVVSQANMVTNFAADAFIHSFYAPYVHPDTGDEQSVLLFTEDIRQNQPIRAPKIFNESGEELEFDEFEESYFAFISDPRMMNYQVASDIQAVIQYFLPEAATRQPVISARPQSAAQANVYPSPMQNMGGAPYGQGMGGYGVPQQNPYGSGMNPSAGGYGQPPMGGGYNAPFGAQPGGYGQAPAPMPQGMPMRHEQPPLPSNNNYQQAPMNQPPMASQNGLPGQMPMGGGMAFQAPMGGSMASQAPMGGSMASQAPMGGSMSSQAPMGGSMASQAPMGGSMASQAPM